MVLRLWCEWVSMIFRFRSIYRGSQSHADPFRREDCVWSRLLLARHVRRGGRGWKRRLLRVYT